MSEKFSLKDHLFNQEKVEFLAACLSCADKKFSRDAFVHEVMSKLISLELKDRIRWIADVLSRYLPKDYDKAMAMIVKSLPPPLDETKTDDDFGDFIFAPFGEYVAVNGVTPDRLTVSLDTLRELTMRFSMEDAIRSFLRAFPKETLNIMKGWAKDDNYHVRRLVSEGTRPLLPWSGRVPLTSTDTLPLLTTLHADQTRYVTRSVANHLNDIAKKEPALVIETLKKWQQQGKQKPAELTWMIKHALRTLIKSGNSEALALLGYRNVQPANIQLKVTPEQIRGGDTIELLLELQSHEAGDFLIDYRIHFVKKNGTTVPKVFKWKAAKLETGRALSLLKRHRLKADATTFTLYPGEHVVDVQINGHVCAEAKFVID